jgi:hypothetical protein
MNKKRKLEKKKNKILDISENECELYLVDDPR